MNKKIVVPTLIFALLLVFSFLILSKEKNYSTEKLEAENTEIIFFYGKSCPHCVIVEEFVEENEIKSKVNFAEKEVYSNSKNAKELQEKASLCNLKTDSIGVPFLWDGKNCLMGDRDIINFFKEKINEK